MRQYRMSNKLDTSSFLIFEQKNIYIYNYQILNRCLICIILSGVTKIMHLKKKVYSKKGRDWESDPN